MNEAMQPGQAASSMADATNLSQTEEDRLLLLKHSNTFTGSFSHTLDNKGRIVVPQAFREMLGTQFWITPSYDFQSIAVYPELQYARMRERYAKMVSQSMRKELIEFTEFLDALSYRGQECDAQGRVLLPARIRQIVLGEEKDVEITGANDHVRIVTRTAGDSRLAEFMKNLPGILDIIGSLNVQ